MERGHQVGRDRGVDTIKELEILLAGVWIVCLGGRNWESGQHILF